MPKSKSFLSLILGVPLLLGTSINVFSLTPTPTPTPQPNQESYVLFYPVVAGKTEGDSLYFLKLARDRLIELLTFGNEKKSEISLKIATKRLLEAEKLFKAGKANLAEKTLSKFATKLAASYEGAIKVKASEEFGELIYQIDQQAQKYHIVLRQMLTISPESEKKLVEETIQGVTEIQNLVSKQINEQ